MRTCPRPEVNTLSNGIVKFDEEQLNIGGKAIQSCQCGYELTVSSTCGRNGWTEYKITCEGEKPSDMNFRA